MSEPTTSGLSMSCPLEHPKAPEKTVPQPVQEKDEVVDSIVELKAIIDFQTQTIGHLSKQVEELTELLKVNIFFKHLNKIAILEKKYFN